jgi:hypothetical protein
VAHLVAALCSLVWQNRKRSSFSCFAKPYLEAISSVGGSIAMLNGRLLLLGDVVAGKLARSPGRAWANRRGPT